MEQTYSWPWVQAQVTQTIERWHRCALPVLPPSARYTPREQRSHEKAYDKGLRAVQSEARRMPRNASGRLLAQQRIVGLFPRFASIALGLADEQPELITAIFFPWELGWRAGLAILTRL
jgi:hypothetical protein